MTLLAISDNKYNPQPKIQKQKLSKSEYKKLVISCFERDNYTCRSCGRQFTEDSHVLSPHHIKKRSAGGKHTLKNFVSLCTATCHRGVEDGKIPNDFKN